MGVIRRHVLIRGHVQGVGFRYWTRGQAEHATISGWVRNRADGAVEAELEGSEAAVKGVIDALHRGPGSAVIDGVEVTTAEPEGTSGFRVLSDAR